MRVLLYMGLLNELNNLASFSRSLSFSVQCINVNQYETFFYFAVDFHWPRLCHEFSVIY